MPQYCLQCTIVLLFPCFIDSCACAQVICLNMSSLFVADGAMADRVASFCSLLWEAIFLSCFLLDSLTSLAYAAQIYYPYSIGICPYMGRMDCGMHLRLFTTVVLVAAFDTAVSMAFTLINATWLEGQHYLRLTLHIANFLLETVLLVCAVWPPRFGMTKGQGGGCWVHCCICFLYCSHLDLHAHRLSEAPFGCEGNDGTN
jgi:hypothetical protein